MFHLRVTIKGDDVSEENVFSDDTSLQNILDVLHAMIVQWLSVHHFRPRQISRTRPSKITTSENEPGRSISPRKRPRPMSQPREEPTSKRDDVFARWSRIKTARPELFRTSSEHQCACLRLRAALEEVEALASYLAFLERLAGAQMSFLNVGAGRLQACTSCPTHAVQIVG